MTCREKKMSAHTERRLLRVVEGGGADLRPFRSGSRWFADLTERKTIALVPERVLVRSMGHG
jgi:hypothetical protein